MQRVDRKGQKEKGKNGGRESKVSEMNRIWFGFLCWINERQQT